MDKSKDKALPKKTRHTILRFVKPRHPDAYLVTDDESLLPIASYLLYPPIYSKGSEPPIKCLADRIKRVTMDFLAPKYEIFKNPEQLPLNELCFNIDELTAVGMKFKKTVNLKGHLPAIHDVFIDPKIFPIYKPYNTFPQNKEGVESFKKNGNHFIEGLNHLLRLNYHQFWCHIAKNPTAVDMLLSYIAYFTPTYEFGEMQKGCVDVMNKIHDKVLKVFIRIFTWFQGYDQYMAAETVFDLLKTTLMKFPVLVNFTVAFQRTCPELISEIYEQYFVEETKPEWEQQIQIFLEQTRCILDLLGGHLMGLPAKELLPLPKGVPPKPNKFNHNWYEGVLTYCIDMLETLETMLQSLACINIKAVRCGLPKHLTYFYSHVFPYVYKLLGEKRHNDEKHEVTKDHIMDKLAIARQQCVHAIGTIIINLIQAIAKEKSRERKEMIVMDFLRLITVSLEDELFVFDYHNTFNLKGQFKAVARHYPELDQMQTRYINKYLEHLPDLENITLKKIAMDRKLLRVEFPRDMDPQSKSSKETQPPTKDEAKQKGEQFDVMSEEAVYAGISIIADTFPDFGSAFIKECLLYCNGNPIQAIVMLLDDNLPPHIQNMDRQSVLIPPEPEPKKPTEAFIGKKPREEDTIQLLDNISQDLKDITLKSATMQLNDYDDDFDDREPYEPVPIPSSSKPVDDNDGGTQSYNRRPPIFSRESEDDDSSDDSDGCIASGYSGNGDTASGTTEFRPFCLDPAKVREQRERARAHHRGGRGGGRPGGGNRDVIGRPKGHGQDDKVFANRDKKTVNKASRANHNRKRGAQKKVARGMY